MAGIHLIFFFFLVPTALPFYFGQKDSELLWVREREREVREIGREGVSFDILFWGRNEEIDVIRLREYDLFLFFNYNRNFLLFEIFGEGTKQIELQCKSNEWYTTKPFFGLNFFEL